MKTVSVCMATYNGSGFIKEQLTSILEQLNATDEVVIVDDASTDDTLSIISDINDDRIIVHINPQNLGVNLTFERCINLAKGDVIFLSDQDDIWLPERYNKMLDVLHTSDVELVVSNYSLIDREGHPLNGSLLEPLLTRDSTKTFKNLYLTLLGRRNYYGCVMCFTKHFARKTIPFPKGLECHDLWLAICANVNHKIYHMEENTLAHRIHSSNASIVKRPLLAKLKSRIQLVTLIIDAMYRKLR